MINPNPFSSPYLWLFCEQLAPYVTGGLTIWAVARWYTKKEDKVVAWAKKIETNDLHHLQKSITGLHDEMKDGLSNNTSAIVTELRELRQDLRNLNK